MIIENITAEILSQNHPSIDFFDGVILENLRQYAKDNLLEMFVSESENGLDIENLKVYLAPLNEMTDEELNLYLGNYSLTKEFRKYSGILLNEALKKYNKEKCDVDIDALEKKLTECISRIYTNSLLSKALGFEISESLTDLNYLKGKSEKYSIRLARRVGLI